jgi:hypothetical protein
MSFVRRRGPPRTTAVTNEPPIRPSGSAPSNDEEPPASGERRLRASEVLAAFVRESQGDRITLGELAALFGDRAFGMLLLVLAIPNVMPIPGLSTIVGIPTVLLGLQMIAGWRQPWLPKRVAAKAFDRKAFVAVIDRVLPRIERVERHMRGRLSALTEPPAERLLGIVVVALAVVISLPIVFGNLPPAIAIGLIALGLMEKDGGFVIAGLIAALIAFGILAAVVFGLGGAAMLVIRHGLGW